VKGDPKWLSGVIGRSSSSADVWNSLKVMEDTAALKFHWNGSRSNRLLLKSVAMESPTRVGICLTNVHKKHAHMLACTLTCIYIHVHTFTYMHISYVCAHTHIHARCTYIQYMHVAHTYIHIHARVRTHAHTYMCIVLEYPHTHKRAYERYIHAYVHRYLSAPLGLLFPSLVLYNKCSISVTCTLHLCLYVLAYWCMHLCLCLDLSFCISSEIIIELICVFNFFSLMLVEFRSCRPQEQSKRCQSTKHQLQQQLHADSPMSPRFPRSVGFHLFPGQLVRVLFLPGQLVQVLFLPGQLVRVLFLPGQLVQVLFLPGQLIQVLIFPGLRSLI